VILSTIFGEEGERKREKKRVRRYPGGLVEKGRRRGERSKTNENEKRKRLEMEGNGTTRRSLILRKKEKEKRKKIPELVAEEKGRTENGDKVKKGEKQGGPLSPCARKKRLSTSEKKTEYRI